jgi:hypothetical protein
MAAPEPARAAPRGQRSLLVWDTRPQKTRDGGGPAASLSA